MQMLDLGKEVFKQTSWNIPSESFELSAAIVLWVNDDDDDDDDDGNSGRSSTEVDGHPFPIDAQHARKEEINQTARMHVNDSRGEGRAPRKKCPIQKNPFI